MVRWCLFLVLLTTSGSTCLQHSPNHIQVLFPGPAQYEVQVGKTSIQMSHVTVSLAMDKKCFNQAEKVEHQLFIAFSRPTQNHLELRKCIPPCIQKLFKWPKKTAKCPIWVSSALSCRQCLALRRQRESNWVGIYAVTALEMGQIKTRAKNRHVKLGCDLHWKFSSTCLGLFVKQHQAENSRNLPTQNHLDRSLSCAP